MNKSDSQSILVQAVLLVILIALASSLYLIPLETVSTDGAVNTKTFTLIAENWGYNQTQGGPVLRAEQGDNINSAWRACPQPPNKRLWNPDRRRVWSEKRPEPDNLIYR